MRVLYKDFSDGYLSVAEVTGTTYYEEEQVLEFIGSDRDFAIQADERLAEKLVRDLYENGRLDVTAYEPADVDFLFDEDSEDFEEEDEDFDDEDMLNVYFADDDTDGIHIPRTIRFPKNRD